MSYTEGLNCIIDKDAIIGDNVVFKHNVIVEAGAYIGDNTYIDSNTIVRGSAKIGEDSFIGAGCIIGEYLMDFCVDRKEHRHQLSVGRNALIRSETIIYAGSDIGENFQTGHRVTIREKTSIGNNVSIGTLSDIQGNCKIGNYVRVHSNAHIGQLSVIDDFVWIYPYVVLTNDPTPPSKHFKGVHIHPFAIIATGSVILPGIEIGQDALVAASALVNRPVDPYAVVAGNPAKVISDVRKVKNHITGEPVYPWRNNFENYMPWKDSDFESWYSQLDVEERQMYKIENMI